MRASPFLVRFVPFLALLGAAALISCGKDSTGVDLGGVASVSVSPPVDTVFIGATITLAAAAMDANGGELSGREVFWHSEHPEIAVVSEKGAVTGIVPGDVRIAASVEGIAGFCTVTVLPKPPAGIELSSNTLSLTVGQESQLRATVRDAEGGVLSDAPVDWKSNSEGVATVSDVGLVHGVAQGTATITATSGTVSATTSVTVSPVPANAVVVSPGEATRFVGENVQLAAQVTDANGDPLSGRPISWSSNAPSVASVSPSSGLVTAVAPGTATITATSEGKSGKSTITVKQVPVASVDMNPGDVKLEIGQTTTITATPKSADGTPLTGRTVTWKSSVTSVATVSSSGLVTAKSPGPTLIQATSEGITGTALVTVSDVPVASVVVSPDTATLVAGQSKQLTAKTLDAAGGELTGRTIAWSSSDENVASVSSSGKVLAIAAGPATITATSEGKSGTAQITVLAPVASVAVNDPVNPSTPPSVVDGQTLQLAATRKDANGTVLLDNRPTTWASSDQSIATVSSEGLTTGVKVGVAKITATSGGVSGSADLTVTSAAEGNVVILPADTTLSIAQETDLKGLVIGKDGVAREDKSLSWKSDKPLVAKVSGDGHVQALLPGSAMITASSDEKKGKGTPGTAKVTVVLLGP